MKSIGGSILCCLFAALSFAVRADEVKTVGFGSASVVYDYQVSREGVATLSLNTLVSETNDSLRGLKNNDPQRLGKLGQLIYQCKLLRYAADKNDAGDDEIGPMLVSRNYSLFTGVDVPLAADERIGIHARALRRIDAESLFTSTLGSESSQQEKWETLGQGTALNLKQIDINLLHEGDLIEVSESIDVTIRFPVYQVEKPVQQWRYNFDLRDFRRAQQYIDQNCTAVKLVELIKHSG